MARYMRSYGQSHLGGPVVVNGPGAIQLGPHISLAPSRRGLPSSHLRPPVVVATPLRALPIRTRLVRIAVPRKNSWLRGPVIINGPPLAQIGPPVTLAPQRRGRPASELRPPALVAQATLVRPLDATLARRPPLYRAVLPRLQGPVVINPAGLAQIGPSASLAPSRRGVAKSALRPPAAVAAPTTPAPPTRVAIARTPPRPVRNRLFEPLVVGAATTYLGPGVKLAPLLNRRSSVTHALRAPAAVAAPFVVRPIATRLSYARRGEPLSRLYPPVAIGDGIAFGGPATRLASIGDRKQPVWSQLTAPTVVAVATLSPPLRVALTRIPFPRKARAKLRPPVVVGTAPAFHGPGVRLVTPITTRQPVRHVLVPPAVVVSNAPFAPIQATRTYSRRGLAKPILSPPTVIGGPVAFRGPGVKLTAPANSRAPVRHLLQPPTVVGSIAPFAPLTVSLTYSRRGKTVSQITAPRIVGAAVAFHGPGVRLVAPSDRRAPVAHRLAAPTLVTPAAFSTPATAWLVPSSVTRARGSRLAPPTLIGGRIAFRGPGVRLVNPLATKSSVAHRLNAPAVVGDAVAFGGPATALARSTRPPLPTPQVSPPTAVGTAGVFHGPGIKLTSPVATKQPVRYRLSTPTVVNPFPVAYHGPGVRVASISNTRRPVAHRISPPTVLATPYRFHGPGVRLTTPLTTRRPVRHGLAPPTVVNPFPIAFRGPGVKLAPPINRRAAVRHALLYPPAVIGGAITFHGPRVRLVTPINARAAVRYRLGAPTLVTPAEAYYGPLLTLAPASRGTPASTLSAPAVVGAGVAHHGPRVKLTPLLNRRAPLRGYRLAPPTVVQPLTLIFFGPLVALAPPSSGKPLSQLAAPAVIGAGVTYRAVQVSLAPSSRGITKPHLSPPAVVGTAALRAIAVTLTQPQRPKTATRLAAPIVVAISATSTITVTLAPLARRRVIARLRPPILVRLQPFRPLTVKLARIRPARVRSILRAALLPPPSRAQQTLRVKLAQPTRRRTISTLAPPALIGGGIVYRPVQTHLARNVHPPVNRMLGAPTVIILISACHGYAGDHAPSHGYITDTSECAAGETGDHTDAGGMIQDTSEDGGYAGDHPQAGGYVTDTGG